MDRRRAAGALLALAACFATATAAPTSNHTALDLYDGPTEGCYYNFQHYGEGDRIMTNEPCLNCTCHNRMLMCYLRVCPFTKPIGQDCTVEKRADQCCPIVTCPDVPVDLLTSTSTTSPAEYGGTGVGRVDKYGCSINGKYFPEGAKVPSTPNKPCEHCYCIRNMTTCVMQECTLHVDGCTPIYHKDVCCPVRYFCDHPEDEPLQLDDMTTTTRPTPGFLLTTTTTTEEPTTEIQTKRECIEDGQIYADGALIKTEKPCVHCYCMKGDIVCVVQECGTPMENEGKNCTSIPPREGQCCPDTYICEGDEITTGTPLEEIATTKYRSETDKTYTEPSLDIEGSGDEIPLTTVPSELSTPKVEQRLEDKGESSPITTESFIFEETEHATTEPDKGLNTVPSDIIDKEHTEPTILEQTTIKEDILSTTPFVSHDLEMSTISTVLEQVPEIPKTTSSEDKMEKPTTVLSVPIEDETTQATIDKTTLRDQEEVTGSEIELEQETAAATDSDQSRTTESNIISELTTKPVLPEQTTLKSETVTEMKQTTPEIDNLGSIGTSPKDEHTEATVMDVTEYSSEASPKDKTTTVHDREETESSKTSEESEISTPSLQREITEQISEVTEPALIEEEPTTHMEVAPAESSEPPIFDENTTKHDITELEQPQTTISSIEDGGVPIETTPKVGEEVKEPTESTTLKEDKASTTESLVKETDTTQQPSHEQTLAPDVESEQKPTTEQILEQHTVDERVSTLTPSTESVPQDENQETTEVNVMTTLQPAETTTLNPEDNEISEDILPPGRIPGEGDCLLNGVTYRNDSSVPNTNKCQSSCKCISSIIKCDPIICSPQPEYMENCQLAYDTPDSCCPTYICEETKETIPPQSHSQMSGTESPSPAPSLQCNGDECELSVEKQPTTDLPDLTKISTSDSCGPEGCESQVPEQQPEKCVGEKCTECVNENCQLPSSQEMPPHIPSETIPQGCEGSENCQETKTEIPLCEGESCVSESLPPAPEIPTPCEGNSCLGQPENCTSDKCASSDNIPPQPTQESDICTDESGCKQIEEKECEGDNCRRHEDSLGGDLSSKCTSPDCPQKEPISPGEESSTPLATTEKTLLEESTILPESHITLLGESSTQPNIITDSISESTTSVPHSSGDHKVSDISLDTETSDEVITTQSPHVTVVLEGENTVPDEKITETETYHTEQPLMTSTGEYTDEDRTTVAKETDIVHTESPAVTDQEVKKTQETYTTSPVESATGREDTPTETPEPTLNEIETEKPQTPLSEFESIQPEVYEPTTKTSVSDQPEKSTDFKTHDEGTEIPKQHVTSTSIPSTQEISGLKTTPEYIEQSTTLPELPEKVGEQENITRSSEGTEQSTELPEISKEHDRTTLLSYSVTTPAEKIEHVTTIPSDIEKEISQQTTTPPQDVTSIVTDESITPSDMKTDLPSGLVTDALKPVDDKTGTETTVSPATILHDTESPLESIPEDKLSSEVPETMTEGTESPALEGQTEKIDSYPTKSQTTIAETTQKPEDGISPELPIEELQTETPIQEGSLAPDTKATAEPSETARPEIPTVNPVTHSSESTEPIPTSQDQESTSEIVTATEGKIGLTDKPTETDTEISIPVPITEEPSTGTKETEYSQSCDNENECKKTQVPETFVPPSPCQGDSCIVQEEDCKSGECTQSGIPPKTTQTEICAEESGCIKPSEISPECTEENCRKTDLGHEKIPISDTEKTTESPSILEEEVQTKIPVETHATETVTPVSDNTDQAATQSTPSVETEMPKTTLSYLPDRTINETLVEDAEKDVTEIPESLITSAPIPSETHKYDFRDQTDTTQPSEVTQIHELPTKEPEILDTELPSSHDIIPEKEITMVPEEQSPIEQQGEVTKTPVAVEVTIPSTEMPVFTETGEERVTELPELSRPEENELITKPETTDIQTISPEQHEPELPQPEVVTEQSEVTSTPEQDHEVKVGESETEVPEILHTIPDLSTTESTITQGSETTKAETGETTEIPHITEKSTEPKQEFSETTPYLVELEEHTHKIEEDITTLLSSEEPITQEAVYIHDTEKDHDTEMSTHKPSDLSTESVPHYTEKPAIDHVSLETITPESHTTISEEMLEITTESSITEGIPSETSKPTSPDTQELFSKLGTDSTDQEKEISTVAPTLPEEKLTTIISFETDKSHTPTDESVPQTEQYTTSSTAGPFETTVPEEFTPASTKTTALPTEKDIATQSPSVFDKYTKPDTSTDGYPSTHASETQKPVFSDMPPTEEVPQPEDESHFPPTGGYGAEPDYAEEDQAFGPGTCRYGGKVYVSAQQIPRDDPCDFCFCFRSDIICLQQSCPPPIHGCHEEPIQGFCCPRYECPVSMATTLNVTTTTTTTTTTLPPHFLPHAYKGAAQRKGCQIKGHIYKVGEVVRASSGPCLHCTCGGDGQMKCDPKVCTPEPMLRQMIAAAVSTKRRR